MYIEIRNNFKDQVNTLLLVKKGLQIIEFNLSIKLSYWNNLD